MLELLLLSLLRSGETSDCRPTLQESLISFEAAIPLNNLRVAAQLIYVDTTRSAAYVHKVVQRRCTAICNQSGPHVPWLKLLLLTLS